MTSEYDDDNRFEYMDDHLLPLPDADDVPVRIWANIEIGDDNETFIEFLSDSPWSEENPGVEYIKAGPWLEMHNAPHDGTDILTWDGNAQVVLFWSKYGNGWTCGNPKIKYNPTHWMPLPQPPSN